MFRFLSLAGIIFCCISCHPAHQQETTDSWAPPPAGTVVAADSMKAEDQLNDFYFAVKLSTSPANNPNRSQDYGFVYDVMAHFGPNKAVSTITMPRGGKNLKPILRKSPTEKYAYILGFIAGKDIGGDGSFKEYYEIAAKPAGQQMTISIRSLKDYSLQ